MYLQALQNHLRLVDIISIDRQRHEAVAEGDVCVDVQNIGDGVGSHIASRGNRRTYDGFTADAGVTAYTETDKLCIAAACGKKFY